MDEKATEKVEEVDDLGVAIDEGLGGDNKTEECEDCGWMVVVEGEGVD